jgi:hypothetical protein
LPELPQRVQNLELAGVGIDENFVNHDRSFER